MAESSDGKDTISRTALEAAVRAWFAPRDTPVYGEMLDGSVGVHYTVPNTTPLARLDDVLGIVASIESSDQEDAVGG